MSDSPTPSYPLGQNADTLHTASGRPLSDITAEAVAAGDVSLADVQISPETLRAQAAVARAAGYAQLASNLLRAAELTAVPNAEVLRIYDRLRPGRSSLAELTALAETLETQYHAPECAALVREAAEVYRTRGLLPK
jgi:propanediol dehydratase small subunit